MALTDIAVKNLKPQTKLVRVADGGGLFIAVHPSGLKVWLYRYTFKSKQAAPLKIGEYPTMSLLDARIERQRLEDNLKKGIDCKTAWKNGQGIRENSVENCPP